MSDNKPKFYDFVNVYDFTCELPGSKQTIQFKPVTTGQIKKLLTYENETNYVVQEQALDELISSSVLTDGFDIREQYIYDRMFLLIEIRKKTKGEVIESKVTCSSCNSQFLNRTNLDTLEVIQLENKDNVVINLDKVKVHLRHMKRKHQIEDIKPQLFPKNMTEHQIAYMFQVAFQACAIDKIETPNGMDENISMKDRMYFIEQMPMGLMEKIKNTIDDMAFGIKLENKVKCVHCGADHSYEVPIQQNFFG